MMRRTATSGQNIILILTDQHRSDIVGINGSSICHSPSLDRLASRGVNFSNAWTTCALCTPARASIYTGLLPHRHGITRNIMSDNLNPAQIPEHVPTLAERLNPMGYRCHFVGKWHAGERLPTQAGFTGMDIHGYGVIKEHEDYLSYLRDRELAKPVMTSLGTGWAHRLTLAGKMSGPVEASVPYYLTERSIEFLHQRDPEQPFFLALNFWGPHAPYLPCEPYASMYDPKDIPPWPNFNDTFEGKPPVYKRYRDAFIGEGNPQRSWEECAQWAALYFGFATQIDAQIGRVLQTLQQLGIDDQTSVLFSSDHGDLTGAHGGMHDKGGMLCRELYQIPLIGRIPGGVANVTCDLPVSNMDLSKTILELGGCQGLDELDGHSLVPLLKGEIDEQRPDYVSAEFFGNHYAYEARMIVHDGFKYTFHPGAFDELYDLQADPWEMNNLIDCQQHDAILRACRLRLIDQAKATDDELCILCGLFHERVGDEGAPYTPHAMDTLRKSPTRLLNSGKITC